MLRQSVINNHAPIAIALRSETNRNPNNPTIKPKKTAPKMKRMMNAVRWKDLLLKLKTLIGAGANRIHYSIRTLRAELIALVFDHAKELINHIFRQSIPNGTATRATVKIDSLGYIL